LDNSNQLISFVMPHHGRDSMLIETIRSIDAQEGVEFKAEVFVVARDADFQQEEVLSDLRAHGTNLPISIINIPQDKTISYARNTGAARANGEYLAFVDSDVRLSTNWIAFMLSALEPGVVIASAVQIPDAELRMNDIIRSAMSAANIGDDVESLPGANLFLRKDVFDSSEKFLEHLQTCEDSTFTRSLLSQGKLVLTDRTGFVHLGEDLTLASLFKKEIWRGKSNLDLLGESKITVTELPSIVAPLLVLISLLLTLIAIAMGHLPGMLSFLLIALLPALLYSIRLKLRSGVNLGWHKLVTFYSVYFVARGIGMLQRLFERKRI